MEPILNEQQQQLRESAARLCRDFAGPARQRALQAQGAGHDTDAWAQIALAGWSLLLLPEAEDGLGMGVFELSLVMLEAGEQLLQAPVAAACAAVHVLGRAGKGALLQELLAQPAPPAALLLDEDDPYNAGLRWPQATPAGDGYSLQGTVPLGGAAVPGATYLVPARTAEGEAVLTAVAGTGLPVIARPRIDGARADLLVLDGAQVAASHIVARGAAVAEMNERIAAMLRIGISAELIGVAARSLNLALEHLKTRRQFGKPLASFQALQHQCVNVFVDLELNRSLLYRTAGAWDRGQSHPAMIAALKSRTSRAALAATRTAVQLHGAMGYTEEHDIGLYYKRAVALAASHGNENHHAGLFSALTLDKAAV